MPAKNDGISLNVVDRKIAVDTRTPRIVPLSRLFCFGFLSNNSISPDNPINKPIITRLYHIPIKKMRFPVNPILDPTPIMQNTPRIAPVITAVIILF